MEIVQNIKSASHTPQTLPKYEDYAHQSIARVCKNTPAGLMVSCETYKNDCIIRDLGFQEYAMLRIQIPAQAHLGTR